MKHGIVVARTAAFAEALDAAVRTARATGVRQRVSKSSPFGWGFRPVVEPHDHLLVQSARISPPMVVAS